jgi:hypothetical protein
MRRDPAVDDRLQVHGAEDHHAQHRDVGLRVPNSARIDRILSFDDGFDGLPGIRRLTA